MYLCDLVCVQRCGWASRTGQSYDRCLGAWSAWVCVCERDRETESKKEREFLCDSFWENKEMTGIEPAVYVQLCVCVRVCVLRWRGLF